MTTRPAAQGPHPPHEDLVRYLEGSLGSEAFRLLRRHLFWCAECAHTIDLLAGADRLQRERAKHKRSLTRLLLITGVVALVLVGWFTLRSSVGAQTEQAAELYAAGRWDEAEPILADLAEDGVDDPARSSHVSAARLVTIRFAERDAEGVLAAALTGERVVKRQIEEGVGPEDPTSWIVAMRLRQARALRILGRLDEARTIEREVEETVDELLEDHRDRTRAEMHLYRHLLWSGFRESTPADVVFQRATALVEASEDYARTWQEREFFSSSLNARLLAARALLTVALSRGDETALQRARTFLDPVRTPPGPPGDLLLEARRQETEGVLRLAFEASGPEEAAFQAVSSLRAALRLYEQDGNRSLAAPWRNLGAALAVAGDAEASGAAFQRALVAARGDSEERALTLAAWTHRPPALGGGDPEPPPTEASLLPWLSRTLLADWEEQGERALLVRGVAFADFTTWQGARMPLRSR